MTIPAQVDVLIFGAGPAGTTLAALLGKYRPGTRVLIVEKDTFPRPKIGESLLIDVNRILADMGALAGVEAAGFSRKYGATFIWGDGREPFHFLWREGQTIARSYPEVPTDYTWHVDRASYDQILADAAVGHGAEIAFGHTATAVLTDADGERVTGAEILGPDGQRQVVRARFVVDCAGAHGPLHRQRCQRVLDENLRNIAVYGYLRGVGKDPTLNGTTHQRTLILTHHQGWVWVIPLRDGITSVGFVTAVDNFRQRGVDDLQQFYLQLLGELRERHLFADVSLVDYHGTGRLIHSVQEYSYQCTHLVGPGWATCGNAAGFVDAILSIGVYVAQTHAQFLACALRSSLDGDVDEDFALQCYATTVRENLAAFRAVAHLFYAFNGSMSDWWRGCSAALRQSTLVPETHDKRAFLAYFTGFSARSAIYEEAINAFGGSFLLDVSAQLFGDEPLFAREGLASEAARARALVLGNPRLRLTASARAQPFVLPAVDRGCVVPVTRVDFDHTDSLASPAITRRLYLPTALAQIPPRMDGTRSLYDLADNLVHAQLVPTTAAARLEVMKLAYRLACMGAVTTSP